MSDVEHHTAAWHEARAADLLRETEDGFPPAQGPVERAKAHATLAQSMRLGELTKEHARREAATRGRAEARRSR